MTSDNPVLLALKVWIAAAWADGVLTTGERSSIEAAIAIAKLSDAEREAARGWLTNKIELDDIHLSKVPGDERAGIYAAALSVVAVDEQVAAQEVKFLERLQKALHIDAAAAEEIRKRAQGG